MPMNPIIMPQILHMVMPRKKHGFLLKIAKEIHWLYDRLYLNSIYEHVHGLVPKVCTDFYEYPLM